MCRALGLMAAVFLATTTLHLAAQSPTPVGRARPRLVLPGTPATAFSTVQGTATSAAGVPLPDTTVRLRDARVGYVVKAQVTDKAGAFTFRGIDPGNYVVELVGRIRAAVATTPVISVNAGETASVVVRLPSGPSLLAAMLGQRQAAPESGGPAQLIPTIVSELPQAVTSTIPVAIPIGDPVSER